MGGEDGAEGRSSRARSPSSPAAPHLFCSRISSISISANSPAPQGRIENKPGRQKPLRGHPLTAVPSRRSQPPHRAPPCLSAALFSQLRHRDTALNLPAKINSPRLFMPVPPRALGTAECQQLRGQVQAFCSSSPAALWPLLRTGNGHFLGLGTESCSVTSTLKL